MTAAMMDRTISTRDALKRAGNPFRNYFARNPDDDVCARYHVPELFSPERDLLHAIIDLYRYDPMTHSEVVPILGNKGAGKTHLLHSIKHGSGGQWQMLVTPGVYQKDSDFLEYLLFQLVDTLLGGGRQKGTRPLEYIGEALVRKYLAQALKSLSGEEKVELFPPPGIGRWARRLGLGTTQAAERAEWLIEALNGPTSLGRAALPLNQALADAAFPTDRACELIANFSQKNEPRNTAGLMRRQVLQGFARAILMKDETELANFLTYGFAELEFQVRPTRQDLVLSLFKVMMDLFRGLKMPVVVAFDQLEDLLLARRSDDAHKIAETFFAGIVQAMHQIDGLCFLIFAERGLWNRFVPSLDGYIQDRLNNPVHVPKLGTVKAIRLEAPPVHLVRQVVEARLRPVLDETPGGNELPDIYPFNEEQISRIAKTEPTLRDMLQQFRHLFDHMIYGPEEVAKSSVTAVTQPGPATIQVVAPEQPVMQNSLPDSPGLTNRLLGVAAPDINEMMTPTDKQNRINALLGKEPQILPPMTIKSVDVIEVPAEPTPTVVPPTLAMPEPPKPTLMVSQPSPPANADSATNFLALWEQEIRAARRRLEPEGALTGSTRELQAALGLFLSTCHEQGVKVGPWRLQHVVSEWAFGDHPTYGVMSLAHWACKDGQPWKVGIGLFLAKAGGKPKDLEVKISVMNQTPPMVDHLILLRPEDDLTLTGKSKQLWTEAERRGLHARLEPMGLDAYAMIASFPRWLAAVRESLPEGMPMPNLADIIQEKAERVLEQVCMPVQG